MALRDSQDITLALAGNPGTLRVSQDLTLTVTSNPGTLRTSQDVILVLQKTVVSATVSDSQAQQSLSVTGAAVNTVSTTQAPQDLSASGSLTIKLRDSQDLALVLAQNPGTPLDSQDVLLAVLQNPGIPRSSQEAFLVLAVTAWIGNVSDSQAPQGLSATGAVVNPLVKVPDKPSIQLHPVIKPLDFCARPLTQAGKRSSTFITLLTEGGANRAFSMPLGARNQPIAGKVFSFTMGGTLTPGAVGGTLVITPLYGATSDGVNLGQSASQSYSASATPAPWRLKGEIIFQNVDLTPGASLVVCTGTFIMNGVSVLFGSNSPIRVDASAITPSASGALNFAASFAPFALNAQQPTISTKYAFLR